MSGSFSDKRHGPKNVFDCAFKRFRQVPTKLFFDVSLGPIRQAHHASISVCDQAIQSANCIGDFSTLQHLLAHTQIFSQRVAVLGNPGFILRSNIPVITFEEGVIQKLRPAIEISLVVSSGGPFYRTLRNAQALWIPPLGDITKTVLLWWLGNTRANKGSDFPVIPVCVLNVIFVS